jgi:hypothetical protein
MPLPRLLALIAAVTAAAGLTIGLAALAGTPWAVALAVLPALALLLRRVRR